MLINAPESPTNAIFEYVSVSWSGVMRYANNNMQIGELLNRQDWGFLISLYVYLTKSINFSELLVPHPIGKSNQTLKSIIQLFVCCSCVRLCV